MLAAACSNPDTDVDTDIATPVSVSEVTREHIEEYVTATGTVQATHEEILSSEIEGYYRPATNPATGKSFVIGDRVKKGQVIVYIDNPEQENNIRIDSQQLNLDISKSEHEKQLSLYEKGGVTLRELKTAEQSYIDAKYNYENALLQLEKMKIIATFDGIITDLPYFTPGVKVASGEEIVHLMKYEKLIMDINLPGKYLGQITEGQPVRATNYTIPDKELAGSVTQVSSVLDSETRTFKATVQIDNANLALRPGMFVKTEVIVASKDDTIVIPKDIILTRRDRKVVYIVDRGTAEERSITTGLENPDYIEVVEGLNEEERLVVDGYETLRHRSKVKIVQ